VVASDTLPHRLQPPEKKGATTLEAYDDNCKDTAHELSGGRGFDIVIEVVGLPVSLHMSLDIIRPGGTVAAIGVFCDQEFNLVVADVFLRDITLHMNGFANVQPFMWESLRLMERGVVSPDEYFSHDFELANIDQAFKTFYDKSDDVMKVMIRP
jgi:alcohol dehydrogenase